MNKAIIESIEWHKDQLFKLLEDGNLTKIEGEIYLVKTELNEIIEKAKSRQKVKVTRGGKTFYREQMVGSDKEKGKVGGRVETKLHEEASIKLEELIEYGKIPEDIKDDLQSISSELSRNLKPSSFEYEQMTIELDEVIEYGKISEDTRNDLQDIRDML